MVSKYSCKKLRQDFKLLRNDFIGSGIYNIPVLKRSEVELSGIQLIGVDKIRTNETTANILKTVHFFVEDIKFNRYYDDPEKHLGKLAQYPHILTPDFSLYTDMPLAVQIYNIFRNRWCGAFWQEYGLSVIPSVSWSTQKSYDFCFKGLQKNTVVAISSLGCRKNKELFLNGYFEMKKRIDPKQILCFGEAFPEMGDEIVVVNYLETTGRKK